MPGSLCFWTPWQQAEIDSQAKRIEELEKLLKEEYEADVQISDTTNKILGEKDTLLRSALEELKSHQYRIYPQPTDKYSLEYIQCKQCGVKLCRSVGSNDVPTCGNVCWLSKLIKDIEEGVK
jgi:hypothetical protein